MNLSTRLKRYLWAGYFTGYGDTTKPVVFMVDCQRRASTRSLSLADKYHKILTKEEGCTLLPLNECPVVNDKEIIMHYTSTTYKEWCNL